VDEHDMGVLSKGWWVEVRSFHYTRNLLLINIGNKKKKEILLNKLSIKKK